MVYVMSDLHGCYDLYLKMLELIQPTEEDKIYILGDFVDRGTDGFEIIKDLKNRPNVIPLIGNHDYIAAVVLSKLNRGMTEQEYEDMKPLIQAWIMDGGAETLRAFKACTPEERNNVLNIMGDFKSFVEVEVNGVEFVLCHGGLGNFEPDKSLEEYDIDELAFQRLDYSREYFPDKYIVTGHTPTVTIEGAQKGRIYINNRNIDVDCGAVFGFGLGCLRLDDFKEFYVN